MISLPEWWIKHHNCIILHNSIFWCMKTGFINTCFLLLRTPSMGPTNYLEVKTSLSTFSFEFLWQRKNRVIVFEGQNYILKKSWLFAFIIETLDSSKQVEPTLGYSCGLCMGGRHFSLFLTRGLPLKPFLPVTERQTTTFPHSVSLAFLLYPLIAGYGVVGPVKEGHLQTDILGRSSTHEGHTWFWIWQHLQNPVQIHCGR